MITGKDHIKKDKNSFENLVSKGISNKIGNTKEELLSFKLEEIAKECQIIEDLKKQFVKTIHKNFKKLDFEKFITNPKYYIKEKHLICSIEPSNVRGLKVVSVDGSSVSKKFVNIDFAFLKAIAVKYYFKSNHDAAIDYFPDMNGFNNYNIERNYLPKDEKLIEINTSIEMTFMEINLLNKMIEQSDSAIDMIILDGSIVIMPINLLFSKNADLSRKYDVLLKEYVRLYENCKNNGIILIGSIKDTRTSALCHLIRNSIQYLKPSHSNLKDFLDLNYRHNINYFSDLELFNRLLKKNERTCIFNCKRDIDKIRDTGIKKEIPYYFPYDFYAFYLKTTNFDVPCRIEFFIDENHKYEQATRKANLISSIITPISNLNERYGLPIPQIEAHRRAVFHPSEVDLLLNNLKRRLKSYGIELMEKRRKRRPF